MIDEFAKGTSPDRIYSPKPEIYILYEKNNEIQYGSFLMHLMSFIMDPWVQQILTANPALKLAHVIAIRGTLSKAVVIDFPQRILCPFTSY